MPAHSTLCIASVALVLPQLATSDVWDSIWAPQTAAPPTTSTLRGTGAAASAWDGFDSTSGKSSSPWWSSPAPAPATSVWAQTVPATAPEEPAVDGGIWNPFSDQGFAAGTCSYTAEQAVDQVIVEWEQCQLNEEADAVGGQGRDGRCTNNLQLWTSENYLCCYRTARSDQKYRRFRVGVFFYRLIALWDRRRDARRDLPTHPDRQPNSELEVDVANLPTDARTTLNQYCSLKCQNQLTSQECDKIYNIPTLAPSAAPTSSPTAPTSSPTAPTPSPTAPTSPPTEQRRLMEAVGYDEYDEVDGQGLCFHRDSTALLVTGETSNGAATTTVRRMDSLAAGDRVLVVDEVTGEVAVDRVSINLHLRDTRKDYTGVTLHYTNAEGTANGELSLTRPHVVMVNGRAEAAGKVQVGDTMTVVHHPSSSPVPVRVTRIGTWKGGIVNPLTHTGRILAGATHNKYPTFALATTVLDSPHQVQLTLVSMPSVLKIGSWLFPAQLQQSQMAEDAIMMVCALTCALQAAISWLGVVIGANAEVVRLGLLALESIAFTFSVALFVAVDICIGTVFLVTSIGTALIATSTAATATGVATLCLAAFPLCYPARQKQRGSSM